MVQIAIGISYGAVFETIPIYKRYNQYTVTYTIPT